MVKKAMIMAAGAGTRLDPLTQKIPKPMVPIANRPIIELILSHIKKFGINDVIANTHTLAESIHERFTGNNGLGINFNYVYEKELSGTAGGVKKCERFFEPDETFLVISGDALTDIDLNAFIKKHKSSGALASMALKRVPLSEVKNFGVVVVDDKSRVIGFQEKPDVDKARSTLVNTGIYVFESKIFKYIPEGVFYDFAKNVFPVLMANNELLCAHVVDEYWSDIGTINQYRSSSYDILTGKVHINLPYTKSETGWISKDSEISPKSVFNGKVIIGNNTMVEDGTRFLGNNIIGSNCVIGENVQLRNTIIWDNVVIEKGTRLDGCIIANNARIGRESIITPGCIIPDGCVISEREKLFNVVKLQSGNTYSSSEMLRV
ncbi:MAG: NDP-sugar synthase [Candidatus Gastranaerophilales bacterium]|nr:NDP-sugar synthase [Candidatus Gastranaerophilales bacterium]